MSLFAAGFRDFLDSEVRKPYMQNVFAKVAESDFRPEKKNIFRALATTPLDDVKVVILGQDPYPTPGLANGLAFAVNNKISVKPPSLKNIFKEVENSLNVSINYNHSDLTGWAHQGVLLLNTSLTVPVHNAGGHSNIGWQKFTDKVINILGNRDYPLVFMLWGNHARVKKHYLSDKGHLVLEASHPSPLAASKGDISFKGCDHFRKANEWLTSQGKSEINWEQTSLLSC